MGTTCLSTTTGSTRILTKTVQRRSKRTMMRRMYDKANPGEHDLLGDASNVCATSGMGEELLTGEPDSSCLPVTLYRHNLLTLGLPNFYCRGAPCLCCHVST